MYKYINENKLGRNVGDCVVRAISTLLNQSWDETYIGIVIQGFISADMPSSDSVWGDYLIYKGYEKSILPRDHRCHKCRNNCRLLLVLHDPQQKVNTSRLGEAPQSHAPSGNWDNRVVVYFFHSLYK